MSTHRIVCLRCVILCLLLVTIPASAADNNGDWQLKINGTSLFFYGSVMLTAGLEQDWEILMDFTIKNGQFDVGSGKSRLVGDPRSVSKPEEMFSCRSIAGSYMNSSLKEVTMPHIRYQGFPVSGQLLGKQLTLSPALHDIGNFISLIFECKTTNSLADVWEDFGDRNIHDRGKRLGVDKFHEGDVFRIVGKEIQFVEPRGDIELPLIDGLLLKRDNQTQLSTVRYELRKIR